MSKKGNNVMESLIILNEILNYKSKQKIFFFQTLIAIYPLIKVFIELFFIFVSF